MERINVYTPDQTDLLWQWNMIMKTLKKVDTMNLDDVQALHVWHEWAFNECYDIGLITEMCELRDKYK